MTEPRDGFGNKPGVRFMNKGDAKHRVETQWMAAVQSGMGCPVLIDDSLTEEHPWGWVFYFVASEPDKCKKRYHKVEIAYYRATGNSIPVGTKGLENALQWISDLKERLNAE
jgi:hypothetical protein